MDYILVTHENVQSVFAQGGSFLFDFQTDVTYFGDLILPANSILRFSGGVLSVTGNITGNHTVINAPATHFLSVHGVVNGTWNVPIAYPEWFGANYNGDNYTTNDSAISQTLSLIPGEIQFTQGIYMISNTIYTNQPNQTVSTNILIGKNATLKAALNMSVMIMGNYPDGIGVHNLTTLPKIYGGGTIDGDNKACCGIVLQHGYRVMIEHLCIKNVKNYGFTAASNPSEAGSCVVRDCVFENHPTINPLDPNFGLLDNAIAIHNNHVDCNYENIMIIDFKIGVLHDALNGKYVNVHAWLSTNLYWKESVVFKCLQPDLNLYCCDADTMRKLVEVENIPYFFANIINCRAYKNDDVVSDSLCSSFKPIVVDKGASIATQIMILGGAYWFDVNYTIIEEELVDYNIECYDRVSVIRYNRSMVDLGYVFDEFLTPFTKHNQLY